MIRMYARRLHGTSVNPGADEILFGMSLPSGSRINDISIDVRVSSPTVLALNQMGMTAVEGWILPVLDPDAATSFLTLWDTLVPKDTDVEVVDLDTGAADSTPFFEPGEPDWSDLLEVGLRPERVYHKNVMHTIGRGSVFSYFDTTIKFLPGANYDIRIRKNYRVSQPSVLVFAIASPSLDDTTATLQTAAAESEWGQMKYIGHVMERAMLHLFGVTEAGAETPWEEATALLKKHLEPDPYEKTGATFTGLTYNVIAKAIVDHSVEGRLEDMTISTGR